MARLPRLPVAVFGQKITKPWGDAVRRFTEKALTRLGGAHGDITATGEDLQPERVIRPSSSSVLMHAGGNASVSMLRWSDQAPATNALLAWDGLEYAPRTILEPGNAIGDAPAWDGSKYTPGAGGIQRWAVRLHVPAKFASRRDVTIFDPFPTMSPEAGDILLMCLRVTDGTNENVRTSNRLGRYDISFPQLRAVISAPEAGVLSADMRVAGSLFGSSLEFGDPGYNRPVIAASYGTFHGSADFPAYDIYFTVLQISGS